MEIKNKNKNKTVLIICLSAAFAVVFASAAVFFAVKKLAKSPEARISRGFEIMAQELDEYGRVFSGAIDIGALDEKNGTLHTNADLSFTAAESKTGSINAGIDALISLSGKRAGCSIAAGMYGFKMDIGEAAATQDTIYIMSPMFLKDTYGFSTADIGREFNASPWSSILGRKLPDDLSLELFKAWDSDKPVKEITDAFSKMLKLAVENAVFEDINEKKDNLSGVRMTIDKDAAPLSLKTDAVLDFYFDGKGRIVNVATLSDIETQDGAVISVDISFMGEERVIDVIKGSAYFEKGGRAFDISCTNDFDKDDMSYDMELEIETDGRLARLEADGELTDIVKDEGFTLRVNNASLYMDGKEAWYASAVIELETSYEMPEIPDDYVNLLDMSETQAYSIIYEIADLVG